MKVHELLDRREKWTQCFSARDKYGSSVPARNRDAVRWCLYGALRFCYRNDDAYVGALQRIQSRLQTADITWWNDYNMRTFDEVRALAVDLDI